MKNSQTNCLRKRLLSAAVVAAIATSGVGLTAAPALAAAPGHSMGVGSQVKAAAATSGSITPNNGPAAGGGTATISVPELTTGVTPKELDHGGGVLGSDDQFYIPHAAFRPMGLPTGVTVVKHTSWFAGGYFYASVIGSDGNLYYTGSGFDFYRINLPSGVNPQSFVADGTVIGSNGTLYRSTDGAALPMPAGVTPAQITSDMHGWAVTMIGSDGNLYFNDFGGTFRKVSLPSGVTPKSVVDGGTVIGSDNNLYRPGDGGLIALPSGVTVSKASGLRAWTTVIGSDGNVYTNDGGSSGTSFRKLALPAGVTAKSLFPGGGINGSDGKIYRPDGQELVMPAGIQVVSAVAINDYAYGAQIVGSDGFMYAADNNSMPSKMQGFPTGVTKTVTGVTIGGVAATGLTQSGTSVSVTVPAHAAGATDVVVTTSDGSTYTLSGAYRYNAPFVISSPASGATVTTAKPTFTGTGTVGAAISVKSSDGTALGTGTVGSDGKWSVTSTAALSAGAASVTVSQDASGSTTSASVSFTVAPGAPVVISSPVAGSTVNVAKPTFTGTGEKGAAITVKSGATTLGTGTVGSDGKWSVASTVALAAGAASVTVSQSASGITTDTSVSFTVAPASPIAIVTPAQDSTVPNRKPTFTGTAVPGSDVSVKTSAGTALGSAKAGTDGKWSVTSSVSLPDGAVSVTAAQTTPGGITTDTSVSFTVQAPAFALGSPAVGSLVRTAPTAFTGTGDAGATIEIDDEDGGLLSSATVDADGNWTAPVSGLTEGVYKGEVRQITTDHTVSELAYEFEYRKVAQVSLTAPAIDATVSSSRPTFSGKGEPGATVTITDANKRQLATATIGTDGTWSATSIYTLTAGKQEGVVTQSYNGAVSSAPYRFTYKNTPVVAPVVLTAPANGSTVTTATPAFQGTGQPNATVNVYGSSGRLLASGTVDSTGHWSATSTVSLGNGAYVGTVSQTASGVTSSDTFSFTVNTSAPATAVTLSTPAKDATVKTPTPVFAGSGQAGAAITVLDAKGNTLATTKVGAGGTWSATSISLPSGSYTGTVRQNIDGQTSDADFAFTVALANVTLLAPTIDQAVTTATPVFSGTGQPGAKVTVKTASGTTLAQATISADGVWSATSTVTLAKGSYAGTVSSDAAGQTSSTPFRFSVVANPAAPVKLTTPVADAKLSDPNPVFTGTGQAGATITVAGSSGKVIASTTVGSNGTWKATSTIALGDGSYVGTVTQNASGVTSTAKYSFTMIKHVNVTLTSPALNSTVTSTTPTFSGKGTPGATISVKGSSGKVVASTTVASNGTWSATSTITLVKGTYVGTVNQTADGNTDSTPYQFTLNPAAPVSVLTLTSPASGATVTTTSPTFIGTGAPGATIKVVGNSGKVLATTTVGTDGKWTATTSLTLARGNYIGNVVQTLSDKTTQVAYAFSIK
ncbi:hypothetical protein LLS1_24270 [Leifsonia sp. LS1]|uniref:Ig-like domain-containing protein n=1 Tax=Leifsonia sp. LS1 TaxID=2828483 RepID=UPI001CFDFC60|nr:Ig-like domain-containing protein [Leifsonia sp. LS1]GIT80758.1 hypothetical protein LLS1_24270 [Leifsonia sp. LS1]